MPFPKIHKQLYLPLYIVFLVLLALYINNIITTDNVEVRQKEEEKSVEEVKDVSVTISVLGSKTYQVNLKNTDTVMDAINKLREEDNKDFTFEKTAYSDGIVIEFVNSQAPTPGFVWKIFKNELDITNQLSTYKLEDNTTYEFKLIRI